ncbi:DUF3224 domain-containing protein [Kitasatospora sp. NA04385]|uniref:DUF3224 domain-containing protein n=1 Tax=Kitasatospora sp. NA04385 TaxID=2742135 RepID=UPI00158FA7B4|nr:DUF3224 domain-containing protein [Kitasatospora sp. NA04385]QKW22560.1 DUF3224 domain-containing protein [Kitasatospora sp. NA04385]
MRASGTFTVLEFTPAPVPESGVKTGTGVGVATMRKEFHGEVEGRADTLFTAAYDQAAGVGTYLAMESFAGALHGLGGTFNFAHSATTSGTDRQGEYFVIVPGSGTADLTGITGTGGIVVDEDGTHRIHLDYTLPAG